MAESPSRERAVDILVRVRNAGFAVSERQLKRWHFEGLLPAPAQAWSSGVPGSETIYPIGTSDQLLALCALRRSFRRSTAVGWLLWWHGFRVNDRYWKLPLRKLAASHDKIAPSLIRLVTTDDAIESAPRTFRLFQRLRMMRVGNALFRQLRKRVGQGYFDTVMARLLEILAGDFEGWSAGAEFDDPDVQHDKSAIRKALGLAPPPGRNPAASHGVDDEEIEQVLVLVSARIGGARLADILRDCSDKQIAEARNELRGLLMLAATATLPGNDLKGKFGLKVLSKYVTRAPFRTNGLILIYLLALKEDESFNKNMNNLLEKLRIEIKSNVSDHQISMALRVDPSLAEFIFKGPENKL